MRSILGLLIFFFAIQGAQANCLLLRASEDLCYSPKMQDPKAWKSCSYGEYNDILMEFNIAPYRVEMRLNEGKITKAEAEVRLKQISINKEVMLKAFIEIEKGNGARKALVQVESTYFDYGSESQIQVEGRGTLIGAVKKIPDFIRGHFPKEIQYFVLTAGHLAKGQNLRIKNNLGENLKTGKIWYDDEVDLSLIQIIANPMAFPLAYFKLNDPTELVVFLEKSILYEALRSGKDQFGPQNIQEAFSELSYPVTPLNLFSFSDYYDDVSVLVGFQKQVDGFQGTRLDHLANQDAKIKLGLDSGLSGTPLVVKSKFSPNSTIGGVVTTSSISDVEKGTSGIAGTDKILKLLSSTQNGQDSTETSEWIFINGVPIRSQKDSFELFLKSKPIGKGVYVDGRAPQETEKMKTATSPADIELLKTAIKKYQITKDQEKILEEIKKIKKDSAIR